jgi:hypothetical protein
MCLPKNDKRIENVTFNLEVLNGNEVLGILFV